MLKMIVACDVCRQELPVKGDVVVTHRTRQVDTKDILPHLCEKCASTIDRVIIFSRDQDAKKAEVIAKYAEANAERMKKLSTED